MDKNLRRATALVRDEQSLRRALDRHSRNRYDLDTVRQVQQSVEGLMETLEFIAQDDGFWTDLNNRAHALAQHEILALGWFNDDAFGALLTACGYHSPPPPPVEELISDTRYAIANALTEGPRAELVKQAQRRLILFLMRTRRQLKVGGDRPAAAPEAVGRRVARTARRIIPVVIGVAAGTAMEAIIPSGQWMPGGYALGVGVSGILQTTFEKAGVKGVEELAERAADWAAVTAIGDTLLLGPPAEEEVADSTLATPDQAIAAHLATAHHQVSLLADKYPSASVPIPVVEDAARHLLRVIELAGDHQADFALPKAARLVLEILTQVPWAGRSDERMQLALEALRISHKVRGEDTDKARPYVTEMFGSTFDVRQLIPGHDRYELQVDRLAERWREMSGRATENTVDGGVEKALRERLGGAKDDDTTEDQWRRDKDDKGYQTY